jgi:uncharacterized DUF497 family protein
MRFDWEPGKDRENRHKHGFSLPAGRAIFQDPNRLLEFDERDYGEERWVAIGMLGPVIAYVVYTDRGDVRRLISVRKATIDEQARYLARWGVKWGTGQRDRPPTIRNNFGTTAPIGIAFSP